MHCPMTVFIVINPSVCTSGPKQEKIIASKRMISQSQFFLQEIRLQHAVCTEQKPQSVTWEWETVI